MAQAIRQKTAKPQHTTRARAATGGGGAINYGPLGDELGYVLRRAQLAVFQKFFETFAALDIRPAQYSVLTVIEFNPGISQTQAADALGIKKPNFVAMIDALEARGLARRVPAEDDRRFHGLYLTDTGKAFMAKLHKMSAAHGRVMAEQLGLGPAEFRRLRETLGAVAKL